MNSSCIITSSTHKKNTVRNCESLLRKFLPQFQNRDIAEIRSGEVTDFLSELTAGRKQTTRRNRYAVLSSFFNFIANSFEPTLSNPCSALAVKKLFRCPKLISWKILEKEVVDEIIFRTINIRNRLMLELMARGGMRIGEVLKLTPEDIDGQRLHLREPKVAALGRLCTCRRNWRTSYSTTLPRSKSTPATGYFLSLMWVPGMSSRKRGNLIGIKMSPHDLRRHAATYASRAGTPIEIVSKVILRHTNLATTQRYLGKVSDQEAMHWIENLYR